MALIGCARVSSVGQSLTLQRNRLQQCDKLFEEQWSDMSEQGPRLPACPEECGRGTLRRHKALTPSQITELHVKRQQCVRTLIHRYRISKATVYRYVQKVDSDDAAARPEDQ